MHSRNATMLGLLVVCAIAVAGCEDLVVRDTASLLAPRFQRSEIIGLVAGAGTTFAALPDLIAMLRRRSSKGMNPRMAAITGVFSARLDLLRVADRVAAGRGVEHGRGRHQFPQRGGLPALCPARARDLMKTQAGDAIPDRRGALATRCTSSAPTVDLIVTRV